MDKIVSKIAALGVPGLVFLFAVGATGLAGAASIKFHRFLFNCYWMRIFMNMDLMLFLKL